MIDPVLLRTILGIAAIIAVARCVLRIMDAIHPSPMETLETERVKISARNICDAESLLLAIEKVIPGPVAESGDGAD